MSVTLPILLFLRGALVLAVALGAVRLLRRASASLRHAVLASGLAAVLALPMLDRFVPTWHTGRLPAAPAEAIEPGSPVAEAATPTSAHDSRLEPAHPAQTTVPWRVIVGGVWAAGIAIALLRVAVGALRARRIAQGGSCASGAAPYLADAWRALGGSGEPPPVVTSTKIDGPMVVGAIAPVVVVPAASIAWTADRWRLVLLHELAHVRRRDGIANLIAQLVCSIHWLDPLAWLAARSLREERELAADDAVLRAGARASMYAEHLVEIAIATSYDAPATALAMASPSRFEARVVALLDGDRSHTAAGTRRAIAIGAAALGVAAVAACVSPDNPPTHAEEGMPFRAPVATSERALQSVTEQELDRAMTTHQASGAIAIVLNAKTGMPLAIATRGDGDARATRPQGSTMKPFTFAAALDAGTIDPAARIDCENGVRKYGDKTLADSSPHGVLDLGAILAVSSNVCTAKIAEPLGDRLVQSLRRYHFAAPAHIDTRSIEGAWMTLGEGIRVSALEVAAGYTALADSGVYHATDGTRSERVMTEATARAVMAMLERVVNDADGTGQAARIEGVRVAGKTGTVRSRIADRFYASFVGIVPADAPRFIIFVALDGVTAQGGKVAAPVFATIAARALGR